MKSLLACLALAACNPVLQVESPAPPGRSARLDSVDNFWGVKYYRLELSAGVAMAVTCVRAGPCEHVKATSDDPRIAEVRRGSLGTLRGAWAAPFSGGSTGDLKSAAALVLVGKAPGKTKIHVHAEEGDREVVVTVIPAPALAKL